MITTTDEIYELTKAVMQKCREQGFGDVAQELDDAMHLGSSGLETLGAIRATFITRAATLEKVMDKSEMREVITYVSRAFGRN